MTATRRLALGAAFVIVALTVAAFWLSYAHLHAVAASHGLASSAARSWAWPATLDLFIVAGELLMLRASLARATDWWAIGLTVVGSGGSIALNVFGVGGSDPLAYVVAAVPPTAALLAFGALMRQVHSLLAEHGGPAIILTVPEMAAPRRQYEICSGASGRFDLAADLARLVAPTGATPTDSSTPPPVADLPPTVATTGAPELSPPVANTPPPTVDSPTANRRQEASTTADSAPAALAASPRQRTPRASASAKKNTRRSMTEWVELAGPVFHEEFERLRRQPTGDEFAEAIKKARLGTVSASTAKNIRAEILDRAELPVLD